MTGISAAAPNSFRKKGGHQDGVGRRRHVGPQQGGGQEVLRPGQELQGQAGIPVPLLGPVVQAAAVGRDQGDLRGREEAFQEQQRDEDEEDAVGHGCSRRTSISRMRVPFIRVTRKREMVVGHGPAFPGQGAEEVQDQAADGVELLRGQLQLQGLVEVRQRHGGLDPPEPRADFLQGLLFHLNSWGISPQSSSSRSSTLTSPTREPYSSTTRARRRCWACNSVSRSKAFLFSGT